jgi:hypothetical protein
VAANLPGDTNGDGAVDIVDLNNVRNNFGAVGQGVLGDTDGDGQVGITDLNAVRNNFGLGGAPAAALSTATIEPAKRVAVRASIDMAAADLLFQLLESKARPKAKPR